jgi:MFS family permease
MMPVLVREYIGIRHFGTTLGFIMGIMTIGQLVGPPLSGNVYDNWGSYQGVWLGFVVLMLGVVAGVIALPSRKQNRDFA